MEQPKTRGRPRKADDEKLVRLVLYVPPDVARRVEDCGKPAAIAHLRKLRVKPPAG
jgi:AT hook motif